MVLTPPTVFPLILLNLFLSSFRKTSICKNIWNTVLPFEGNCTKTAELFVTNLNFVQCFVKHLLALTYRWLSTVHRFSSLVSKCVGTETNSVGLTFIIHSNEEWIIAQGQAPNLSIRKKFQHRSHSLLLLHFLGHFFQSRPPPSLTTAPTKLFSPSSLCTAELLES